MFNTNALSYRAARHSPRLRPVRTLNSQVRPLWCGVCDTPWLTAMHVQVATAVLVSGTGSARAWRFRPV
jgi:hypothetical protein